MRIRLISAIFIRYRSEEHTSELQSPDHLVSRLLLETKNIQPTATHSRPPLFFLMIRPPPRSPLFPPTTPFRPPRECRPPHPCTTSTPLNPASRHKHDNSAG